MAGWMAINGEAIFGPRPCTTYGEGPSTARKPERNRFGGAKDVPSLPFTGEDIRYTRKGDTVYAIALGFPAHALRLTAFSGAKVDAVSALGSIETVQWRVDDGALVIDLVSKWATTQAVVFKTHLHLEP